MRISTQRPPTHVGGYTPVAITPVILNMSYMGATVSKFDYAYDVLGRIQQWTQQKTFTTPQISLNYYLEDQLLGAIIHPEGGDVAQSFQYICDSAGNRLSEQIETAGPSCEQVWSLIMKRDCLFESVRANSCVLATALGLLLSGMIPAAAAHAAYLSPTALLASRDGKTLFVACATGRRLLRFEPATRKITGSIELPGVPSGLAWSLNPQELFVTCAAAESKVCVIDARRLSIIATIPAGHTAMAPLPSPDGKTLYTCNRFNHDVSSINLATLTDEFRIEVQREPLSADITTNGDYLLVANQFHSSRSDAAYAGAAISVIDVTAARVIRELHLPRGSGGVKTIRLSPDGKHAAVTHLVAHVTRETSQLDYGWMNANALTIIDVPNLELRNTLLLDNLESGAANPWDLAWSADGAWLAVTHAGTHELSLIDFPKLIQHSSSLRETSEAGNEPDPNTAHRAIPDLADDLPFLTGARTRVKLPPSDRGPRALADNRPNGLHRELLLRYLERRQSRFPAAESGFNSAGAKARNDSCSQGRVFLSRRNDLLSRLAKLLELPSRRPFGQLELGLVE